MEKSPSNIFKVSWLLNLFSIGHQARFILVLKSPVTNTHFEQPRKCPNVELCASMDPVLQDKNQSFEGNRVQWLASLTTAEVGTLQRCAAMKGHEVLVNRASTCEGFNLMRARMDYADKWVQSHERLLDHDLNKYGEMARKSVRVLRYEQLAETPCTCEKLLSWAFADSKTEGKFLVPKQEMVEACRYTPARCDDRRRLGYRRPAEGDPRHPPSSAVVIQVDESAGKRLDKWKRFLQDTPFKWDAQLQALEPRLVRLGYSFYHPEERQYTLAATDGAKRDAFADWAVI